MGFSIPISCHNLIEVKKHSKWSILQKIVIRSGKLFMLGLLIFSIVGPGVYDPTQIRIPGVLQRISICHLAVASIELLAHKSNQQLQPIGVSPYLARLQVPRIFMSLCAAAWLYLTLFFEIPNCPRGYLGPGGLENFSQFFNCTGGVAGYLDHLILGEGHLYKYGAIKAVYKNTQNFDPEGVLGTLSAIFLTCLGAEAGRVTLLFRNKAKQVLVWMYWAIGLLAMFLCLFSSEHFPVNKNLWSLTFSVVTGSGAFFVMAALYYVIDVRKWWSGNPFIYPGLNSILVYVLHYLFRQTFPVYWAFMPHRHFYKLAMNLWGSIFWTIVSFVLHVKRIYVSL